MKVELDLSTEQLENLDKGLVNLLSNLTDKQKVSIIQTYLNEKFDKFYYTRINSWGTEETKISDFGNKLIDELQNKISDSITDDILNNQDLKNFIQKTVDNVQLNLTKIIEQAIIEYAINNLFNNSYQVQELAQGVLNRYRNPETGQFMWR